MRKTNRRRTNNRKRKTGKKQRKIRGGDPVWNKIKHIPENTAAFMEQKKTDMVDGNGMTLYNNIYWSDTYGMVDRVNFSEFSDYNLNIPYSKEETVTKEQLGEIYVWMLSQYPNK